MFDYVVTPDPGVEEMTVAIVVNADAETVIWFPHIERGMQDGCKVLLDQYGRSLSGVRIEVKKVHSHPVDTNAEVCKRYGSQFVVNLGLEQNQ